MSKTTHKIIGMVAQTAIHVGASSNDDLIDLPIQREAHTDWPMIAGSGMKGAWRSRAASEPTISQSQEYSIFGPSTGNAAEHAGAIMVSDARLVLLPVRSLTSHFKWVTCHSLLQRYLRDRLRLGYLSETEITSAKASGHKALVATENHGESLYLEEFRYEVKKASLDQVVAMLADLMGEEYREDIEENLVIVSNDQFNYLSRAAVPLQARIAIDEKSKTVAPGALWYEEYLPAETVMYNCLSFGEARGKEPMSSEQLKQTFLSNLVCEHPHIQVGGNATVGMGWFGVNPVKGERQ